MKILKNILIGFGVVFVSVIGLIVFLSAESDDFRDKQSPFIETFMTEFSEDWDVATVHEKLTNELLEQIGSPAGQNALGVFRTQGRFEGMSDLALLNYTSGTSGKIGQFTFKAEFTGGPALVEIILVESEGKTRVNGLHITPSGGAPVTSTRHEV